MANNCGTTCNSVHIVWAVHFNAGYWQLIILMKLMGPCYITQVKMKVLAVLIKVQVYG